MIVKTGCGTDEALHSTSKLYKLAAVCGSPVTLHTTNIELSWISHTRYKSTPPLLNHFKTNARRGHYFWSFLILHISGLDFEHK